MSDHLFHRIAIYLFILNYELSSFLLQNFGDKMTLEQLRSTLDIWLHEISRSTEPVVKSLSANWKIDYQKIKQRHNKPCKQYIIPQNYSSKAESLPQWLVAIMFILITRLCSCQLRLVDFSSTKGAQLLCKRIYHMTQIMEDRREERRPLLANTDSSVNVSRCVKSVFIDFGICKRIHMSRFSIESLV